jgi:hypothetical protein
VLAVVLAMVLAVIFNCSLSKSESG